MRKKVTIENAGGRTQSFSRATTGDLSLSHLVIAAMRIHIDLIATAPQHVFAPDYAAVAGPRYPDALAAKRSACSRETWLPKRLDEQVILLPCGPSLHKA